MNRSYSLSILSNWKLSMMKDIAYAWCQAHPELVKALPSQVPTFPLLNGLVSLPDRKERHSVNLLFGLAQWIYSRFHRRLNSSSLLSLRQKRQRLHSPHCPPSSSPAPSQFHSPFIPSKHHLHQTRKHRLALLPVPRPKALRLHFPGQKSLHRTPRSAPHSRTPRSSPSILS